MIRYYRSNEGDLLEIKEPGEGLWIDMLDPSEEEINLISQYYQVPMSTLRSALDIEERSRIEEEDDITLILVDAAVDEPEDGNLSWWTLPLGIILVDNNLITVCTRALPLIEDFSKRRVRNFFTQKRSRFVLQLLYRNATYYLTYLRKIERVSNMIERELHRSMNNKNLIQYLELEKSLVYFTTSLSTNELVLEKLLRLGSFKKYPDDEDLLEDVIIENKQAIETANIYTNIMNNTMDAYSSIISNNLNLVMKVLTTITIVLTIPTMVFSFFGMNVALPFQNGANTWLLILGITFLFTCITYLMMTRNRKF